jgi:hypothetical protein
MKKMVQRGQPDQGGCSVLIEIASNSQSVFSSRCQLHICESQSFKYHKNERPQQKSHRISTLQNKSSLKSGTKVAMEGAVWSRMLANG